MRRSACIFAIVFSGIPAAWAQPAALPAFEAASIKPNNSGGNYVEVTPGALLVHSATLATCIRWAYGVSYSQIAGADPAGPGLLNSQRYEIIAKTAGPLPDSELRVMLQNLLAERFKLAMHRQTREMQTYALEVEKSGPKFRESQEDGASQELAKSKVNRQWKRTTMAQLADSLSDAMRAPVADRTGLPGKYDFALDLTPYLPPTGDQLDLPLMMVTAIREQLGLKLTAVRAPVEVLVIDHLEPPSAN